ADELVDETNLDELPRESPRKKTIHEGFWLGRTHVTVGQWRRFVEETGYLTSPEEGKGVAITYKPEKKAWGGSNTGKNWKDPSFGFKLSDDHPVSCINWTDAVAFCDWLNERDAKGKRLPQRCKVRLPTEAEWEYACRAGKQTKFWWGDLLQNGRGRLNMASTELIGLFRDDGGTKALLGPCWSDGFPFVSPVDHYGAKGRNGFDLADMVGNLWQWCMDGRDRNGLERHSSDYGIYECRAMRGGSFLSRPGFVRCASRRRENVRLHISDTGFRIAISANELSR
ncbi:MAG: formylglycine-generating enzyme family protein, partial [Verrucomicrobia bacterium]|nr:formylglycine-generating enzyme family protein [Verrucomicrobiota bacterium]